MEERKTIYREQSILYSCEIQVSDMLLYYHESSPFHRQVLQIPINSLKKDLSFNRTYHLPLIMLLLWLLVLSLMLVIKKFSMGGWTLSLGWGGMFAALIAYLYYFVHGRHIGEVVLQFTSIKFTLYTTKKNYIKLQDSLLSTKI